MSGLYIVQVAICICFMDGFDGQPLYEDKCHVDEMDRRFNGAYNREVVLQRQIGSLKNQLDSFRETIERLQFHLGCLNENGTYLEENVTKSQYCFIKAPFNWKNAKKKCQSFKSYLLEINSEAEQNSLKDKVSGGLWWTGAIKDRNKNIWVWDHSDTELVFTNWDPDGSQPNGESLVEDECKRSRSGYDYTGKVSVTQSGRICQAWKSQTPHSHPRTSLPENYCRNPDGEPAPWCYTSDPNKRFEICNIPYCVTRPLECIRNDDPIGRKYFGTINVTKTGEPCQRWDSQTPHTHRFDELADQENYCRNSIDGTGPWCYTTNADNRWEYCSIPHC